MMRKFRIVDRNRSSEHYNKAIPPSLHKIGYVTMGAKLCYWRIHMVLI